MKQKTFEELGFGIYKERARAFIKVQEGCNQFCSYCIIPYARGPIRSRSEENVIKEVKTCRLRLQGNSADGNTYWILWEGHKYHIINWANKKVHEIDGIERIRLGSIEPNYISNEFVKTIKHLKKCVLTTIFPCKAVVMKH